MTRCSFNTRGITRTAIFCFYYHSADFPALVVKASGLAAGKGVVIATNKEEACQAVKDCLQVYIIILQKL